MPQEKVVAVYDTGSNADAAVKMLESAGYSASDISVIRNEGDASKAGLREPGIWDRLFGRDIDPHEAAAYGSAVLRGGVVVSVRVPESEAPKLIELLDGNRPVDIVDRARTYGSSVAGPPKVVVPPPTSAANLRKDERRD